MSDKKNCGCGCVQKDSEKKEQSKEDNKKEQ